MLVTNKFMFSISKRPTITEIHNLYKEKKATPTQVMQFFLNRIIEQDKKLNSFVRLTEKLAKQKAEELDKELEQSSHAITELFITKPLFGIPCSLKDIILIESEEFTSASNILKGYIAPYSSTVFKKIDSAGAIVLGINNMDQFAMGSSGESSAFESVRNPFDLERIPGGSSSGGAACVGAGLVVFSLGSDTGGSIRQPAAFCDVVGLKPTYGLVSRFGVMPMASSFDQVGGFTNTIYDNIVVTKVLAGEDKNDQTTINSKELKDSLDTLQNKIDSLAHNTTANLEKTYKPLTIGVPKEFFVDGIDPVIFNAIQNLIVKLKDIGHKIIEVSLPLNDYAIAVYYMTMGVEVASNLERIDGIRFATQKDKYGSLFFEHRGEFFGAEAGRRIMLGTYASSAGYYDAYYNKAQKVRELARQNYMDAFKKCDIILTPTTPEFPFKIGEKTTDPIKMYLSDIFTCGINPVRIPGLNIPMGLFANDISKNKLPTGVQLLSPELHEDLLFDLGLEIEKLVAVNRGI
jgi:aspartyl-tRNA(Asn)/glutamyl-tRNA(Gln) amidotransferase subunit A